MTQFIPREWYVVQAVVCTELLEALSCFMHEMCIHGVTIEEDAHNARITAYFDPDSSDEIRKQLGSYLQELSKAFPEYPKAELTYSAALSENWAVAWKDNFKVMEVGAKIMISPPWLDPEPGERRLIIIEPAEAFGTGSHETTQGCLELLEKVLDEREKEGLSTAVLDIGCGSGILAIAAGKLGADSVTAIDNDPVAIESAVENAELNGIERKIIFENRGIQEWSKSFPVVTANLDAMTLTSNIDVLKDIFLDKLVISGVTVDQWDQIKELFRAHSLKLCRELIKTEWVSAVFSH